MGRTSTLQGRSDGSARPRAQGRPPGAAMTRGFPRFRGSRAVGTLVLVLATVTSGGCSGAPAGQDSAGGTEVVDPTADVTDVAPDSGDGGTEALETEERGRGTEERETEEGGPPPEEETSTAEGPAAGGGGRVSIELAGLPVGGGEALDVDGTWCQVLFWRSVPDGVWLDIDSVQLGDQGGALLDSGCAGSPPCEGARISADDPGGCAVMVRPPSPDTDFVEVQLNGTLSCPDQASCDAVGATDGSWTMITNPTGGGGPSEEPSIPVDDGPDGDAGSAEDEPSSDGDDDPATTDTG